MDIVAQEVDLWFPRKFEPLFNYARYKICRGGRGGAKTWNIARALIVMACDHFERVLCTREYQNSIKESVHKTLCDQITEMGLDNEFEITDKTIYCPRTKSEFIFSGLHGNITKIKSMEGITKCWVEEAEKVTERSWEVLIPTIRAEGSEIWISFNPDAEDDPTTKRFMINTPPGALIIISNWDDNPWLPQVLIDEKDYLYKVDPDAADHVWGGNFRRATAAQIFRGKYSIESFTPVTDDPWGENWEGPFHGLDFGFSDDPLFATRTWINKRLFYIEYESYGLHVENDDIAPKLRNDIPGIENYIIRCDNARPETISHIRKKGHLQAIGCDKWKGSVEDGIDHLRSYEKIIIHPRCIHMQDEAKFYKFKVDPLDERIILRQPVDKWNHGWDSIRYGIDQKIKHKRTMYDVVD